MTKKKGFTLVELVAVLVIIAVIALIATPLILNLINKAKASSNKRSVDAYGKAVEISVLTYLMDNGSYPTDLESLQVEYTGKDVTCNIMQIKENGGIYLSECTVGNKEVKDATTEDGWYHYGTRDITNEEYVDMYGISLTKAIEVYSTANNALPEDYTELELDYEGKEVSCDVTINYDGSIYLTKCSVKGVEVNDSTTEDGYYHYGEIKKPLTVTDLIAKANDVTVTTYEAGTDASHEMYTFEHDATVQTEALTDYRYIGSDPYNYVTFNNEEWRIIGVFTVEDENGNQDQRIKIIRNVPLGEMVWDLNGINEWPKASLNTFLNGEYYNSLSSEAQSMISSTKYYLGGSSKYRGLGASDYYTFERGISVYKDEFASEQSTRSTNWTGKIGLMYPSDYVYTYANGVDNTCYSDGYNCDTSNSSSGWLYLDWYQWTIAPGAGDFCDVFRVHNDGAVDICCSEYYRSVRPSLYLKSDIQIVEGNGSQESPYQLKLN